MNLEISDFGIECGRMDCLYNVLGKCGLLDNFDKIDNANECDNFTEDKIKL